MLSKILVPTLLLTSLVYHPRSSFLCSVQTIPSTKGGLIWDEYLKAILPAGWEASLHLCTLTVGTGLARASLVVKVFSGVAGLFLCLTFRIEGLMKLSQFHFLSFLLFYLLLTALKKFKSQIKDLALLSW